MKTLFICDDLNTAEAVAIASKKGYGVEVQAYWRPENVVGNQALVDRDKVIIEGMNMLSIHGPFADLSPGSYDPLVRQLARTRFDQVVGIANELSIGRMILHHGYVPKTSQYELWKTRCTAFFRDFLVDKPDTFHIHLENLHELDPALMSDVVAAVDDPRFDICLDIGHAHCNSKTDVVDWIEALGKQIGYVHMHDNHGETDEHLGLGCGTMPMVDVCNALNDYSPEAIWALEVQFSAMEQSLQWLVEHGFLPDENA